MVTPQLLQLRSCRGMISINNYTAKKNLSNIISTRLYHPQYHPSSSSSGMIMVGNRCYNTTTNNTDSGLLRRTAHQPPPSSAAAATTRNPTNICQYHLWTTTTNNNNNNSPTIFDNRRYFRTSDNNQQQQALCFSTTAVAVPSSSEAEPLLGVGKYKTSTGLVGLAVEPDWYNVMLRKFQALLDKMELSDMPETAQYRMDVTKWCNYVIASVKANPDSPEAVEDDVQMGQVEELIEMADDEMICLDTYLESRMWELVAASNPPVVDMNPDPMRDPFNADGNVQEQDAIRKGMDRNATAGAK